MRGRQQTTLCYWSFFFLFVYTYPTPTPHPHPPPINQSRNPTMGLSIPITKHPTSLPPSFLRRLQLHFVGGLVHLERVHQGAELALRGDLPDAVGHLLVTCGGMCGTWLVGWLVGWLSGWLVGWLVEWMVGWLSE
jgi:hypothetical protein